MGATPSPPARRAGVVPRFVAVLIGASLCACLAVPVGAVPPITQITVRSGTGQPGMMPLVVDPQRVFPPVPVSLPDYRETFADPTFGTRVTRIGDMDGLPFALPADSGYWGYDARHHYSKDQPWNSNRSLIWLHNKGSPRRLLLDGETYAIVGEPCDPYSQGDDRWHPSAQYPNVRINVRGTLLEWYDVVSCVQLRSWTLPFAPKHIGDGEGNPSWDGRYLALCDTSRMFVVDMDPQPPFAPYPNVRIGPIVDFSNCGLAECRLGWVSVSPSGKYVVCKYGGDHPRVYDLDTTTLAITPRPMPPGAPICSGGSPAQGFVYDVGHCDMTRNPFDNDEDVLIGQEHCGWLGQVVQGELVGGVVMVRLKDGLITSLTNPANEAYPHHVSTQNVDRRDVAFVGYYPSAGERFSDEIVAVSLDGSGAVERWAHKHSDTSGECYACEAHAVPSPDGRRVIWSSNWALDCVECGPFGERKSYVTDARAQAAYVSGQPRPVTITADAWASHDPDGTIVSYRFDFGDGTVVGPQTAARAVHTYASSGLWTLAVTTTDDDGDTHTKTAKVTVGSVTGTPVAGHGPSEVSVTPHPLVGTGALRFATAVAGPITVELLDVQGRLVRTLWRTDLAEPALHTVPIDGRDARGQTLAPGLYVFRIQVADGASSGRLLLLR